VERVTATTRPASTTPVATRVFVYSFLTLLLVCGVAGIERWPLTAFRLYADPRRPTHPSWELATVDDAGHEETATLYDLPVAYRNTDRQLGRTGEPEPARLDARCRAWAAAFHDRDANVVALRVYRSRIDARSGAHLTRRLVWTCEARA
jgi:hypothetical protein